MRAPSTSTPRVTLPARPVEGAGRSPQVRRLAERPAHNPPTIRITCLAVQRAEARNMVPAAASVSDLMRAALRSLQAGDRDRALVYAACAERRALRKLVENTPAVTEMEL